MEILKNKLAVKYTFTDYRAKAKSLGLEKKIFINFFFYLLKIIIKRVKFLKIFILHTKNIRKIKLKN